MRGLLAVLACAGCAAEVLGHTSSPDGTLDIAVMRGALSDWITIAGAPGPELPAVRRDRIAVSKSGAYVAYVGATSDGEVVLRQSPDGRIATGPVYPGIGAPAVTDNGTVIFPARTVGGERVIVRLSDGDHAGPLFRRVSDVVVTVHDHWVYVGTGRAGRAPQRRIVVDGKPSRPFQTVLGVAVGETPAGAVRAAAIVRRKGWHAWTLAGSRGPFAAIGTAVIGGDGAALFTVRFVKEGPVSILSEQDGAFTLLPTGWATVLPSGLGSTPAGDRYYVVREGETDRLEWATPGREARPGPLCRRVSRLVRDGERVAYACVPVLRSAVTVRLADSDQDEAVAALAEVIDLAFEGGRLGVVGLRRDASPPQPVLWLDGAVVVLAPDPGAALPMAGSLTLVAGGAVLLGVRGDGAPLLLGTDGRARVIPTEVADRWLTLRGAAPASWLRWLSRHADSWPEP